MVPLKVKITISFLLLLVFLLLPDSAVAQRRKEAAIPVDTMVVADTVAIDSTITVQPKKAQPLNAPVIYEANDSIVFTQGGYAHLYGQAKVNYENIELTADVITMNMDSSTVFATGVTDSLGVMKGSPVFKDGETPYESKVMRYNFKSKKGFINDVVTQQGEGYVTSKDAKKGANDELFLQNGKYTTCDNHDHPHFYLALTKAKVKPKKNVVFGPAYLVVEDVPLPIAIPFGFFPFSSSYSSGFIMPTYGDELNRGFYLRDGGYYFAVSDKMDLKLLGEIFTKGSWGVSAQSNYNKRYRFSGNINLSYLVTKTGEKNLPDYSESKDFKVQWTHRQDPKASPNSTFSASVNFATSSYEKSNLNSYYDPNQYSQNTKTSSVSYSRNFPDQKLMISGTFNIAQTMKDSSLAITLPDLNIALSRIYPFKRKKAFGDERWYEKISLQYTGRLSNSIQTKDNLIFKSNIIKDWRNGMSHNIPVSATFSLFKYINISPSFTYNEKWYTQKVNQSYDPEHPNTAKKDTIYGFNRVYNYNASININTKLYGFYKPSKAIFGDKIEMIRHVFSPAVTLSAAPDFGKERYGFWKTYTYTDTEGNVQTKEYSPYEGFLYGTAPRGKQGSVTFSVSNNIEMKVKSDRDSSGVRKVSIIDELGANISYNMAAETKPWSDLGMSLRLKLSKNYTLSLNTSFATYAYQFDDRGNVFVGDRTEWSYGRFGRFEGLSQGLSYTLNQDTWKKWFGSKEEDEKKDQKTTTTDNENTYTDDTQPKKKEDKKAELDEDGYMAFKMPWSLSISYNASIGEDISKPIHIKNMRYPYRLTHTVNFSGNIKIATRWGFNFASGYDFNAKKISMTTCSISRDLHCFTMSCSLVFGPFSSYNFSIRANSSMLADALKWDKRSSPNSNIQWY